MIASFTCAMRLKSLLFGNSKMLLPQVLMPAVLLLLLSALYASVAATKFVATNHDAAQVRRLSFCVLCWLAASLTRKTR